MPKLNFKNDYSNIAHPKVLEHLMKYTETAFNGYGLDDASSEARKTIQKIVGQDVDVHFLIGGTSTNKIAIAHMLKPYEAVISVASGHINVHETGAIEANGHKILIAESIDGKIIPESIQQIVDTHCDEHMVMPRLVYISNATEIGSIYTKAELKAISDVCKANGLYLYMDGARISEALVAETNDLTLPEIASMCDMFTIGGTKNGLLMGEVLIITNQALMPNIRFTIKQNGGMLAKGFLLGLQFQAFFANDLYLELGRYANMLANDLQNKLEALGYELATRSVTNQVFVKLPLAKVEYLKEHCAFEVWSVGQEKITVRFVTSFATKQADVDKLIELISK